MFFIILPWSSFLLFVGSIILTHPSSSVTARYWSFMIKLNLLLQFFLFFVFKSKETYQKKSSNKEWQFHWIVSWKHMNYPRHLINSSSTKTEILLIFFFLFFFSSFFFFLFSSFFLFFSFFFLFFLFFLSTNLKLQYYRTRHISDIFESILLPMTYFSSESGSSSSFSPSFWILRMSIVLQCIPSPQVTSLLNYQFCRHTSVNSSNYVCKKKKKKKRKKKKRKRKRK